MSAKNMSELEAQVMEIIWADEIVSVRDITEKLKKKKHIAYTTVLTIVQRIYEKGLVSKRKQGKAHVYSAKISKQSYSKSVAQFFLKKFINSFGEIGITSFAESIDSLSKKEKEKLLTLLEQHEKTKS